MSRDPRLEDYGEKDRGRPVRAGVPGQRPQAAPSTPTEPPTDEALERTLAATLVYLQRMLDGWNSPRSTAWLRLGLARWEGTLALYEGRGGAADFYGDVARREVDDYRAKIYRAEDFIRHETDREIARLMESVLPEVIARS